MNPDVFAEWLRRQGRRVIHTQSSYWFEAGPGVYQAFPYHWTIEPGEEELRSLLASRRAIALRYSAPLSARQGKVCYHIVCDDGAYDLPALPRQSRQNVRRGLASARVEPIPLTRLASEGWALRCDGLERQGRPNAEDEAWWRRLCLSAEGLPGFEAWGALVDGQLAASLLAFRMDGCYELLYQQCLRQYMPRHVNNALCYVVTQTAVRRPGVRSVLYGLSSLSAPASVDEFKFRMGYVPKLVRQRVVFHPWLAPLVNRASHAVVRGLVALAPGRHALAKAEGMIRFYLQGQRPVEEQDLPEALQGLSAELAAARAQGRPSEGAGPPDRPANGSPYSP